MLKRIIDILGWLGVAVVIAAVVVRALQPGNVEVWRGLAIAGLVTIVLYIAGQWREIGESFRRRQTRYGALSLASVLIVLGILAGINYIATRQDKRWDLTAAQQFSLSDQTRKVLGSLAQPLEIEVYSRADRFADFRDRLQEYRYASPKVETSFIDVDRERQRALQNGISAYDTVLVRYAGRTERATGSSEQDLTNAIIKAVEGKSKKVYFVQGHREKDTVSSDERTGYSGIAQAMGRDNFAVEKLALAQQADVPADADVLVIAGPQIDYLPQEVAALKRYVDRGGKLLVMLDPPDTPDAPPLTNLLGFLQEWGFGTGHDIVLDLVGQATLGSPEIPVVASYPPHPIVDTLNVITAFPATQTISTSTAAGGRTPQAFLETSPQSFAKKDLSVLRAGGQVTVDEAKGDRHGPLVIGAALSADAPDAPAAQPDPANPAAPPPAPQTRLVVIGDSDFAANSSLGFGGNRDLFMNALNWLAGADSLISLRPRDPEDRRITLPPSGRGVTVLLASAIPLVCFGAGFFTWWRRR
ncbi:MAG: GldG family protein [Anaerolineae bacterium]|nr:GldG family protein [Anaerolineae bacterium]